MQCGATDNLHFDHVLPFSKGRSSLLAENVQLLCARHNLQKVGIGPVAIALDATAPRSRTRPGSDNLEHGTRLFKVLRSRALNRARLIQALTITLNTWLG